MSDSDFPYWLSHRAEFITPNMPPLERTAIVVRISINAEARREILTNEAAKDEIQRSLALHRDTEIANALAGLGAAGGGYHLLSLKWEIEASDETYPLDW